MMAVFQGERYLKAQLDSIFAQTRRDWVLYIQDDGSTDGTLDIISSYIEREPRRIVLFSEKENREKGAKHNFSSLFDKVPKAEYYMFCDQDDIWEKDKLQRMMEHVPEEQDRPFLMYCDMRVMDNGENLLSDSFCTYSGLEFPSCKKEYLFRRLMGYNFITGAAMLYNHALREQVGKIPRECLMHDWWIALVAAAFEAEIIFLPEALQTYRQHGENVLGAFSRENTKNKFLRLFEPKRILAFPGQFVTYKKNNEQMKQDRYGQLLAFLRQYKNQLPQERKREIKIYLRMLTAKKKLPTLCYALREGYVLWSRAYSMKFYLL